MSREAKKKAITVGILSAVLLALVLVYIFWVAPLLETEEEPLPEPPYVAPGEGLYLNTMVTVYPEITKASIVSLEINNKNGSFAFHKYYDNTMEAEDMRLKGHEKINYDQSMYSLLIAYVYLPVSYQSNLQENAPMRDLSLEKMKEYGVTEDTCRASYTVGYKENGETKYHTVYIGEATLTSETTYYVALKGRNSVYRFHQEGVETCLLAPMEEYLSPYIFGKFKNSTEAFYSVEAFKIGLTDPEKAGTDDFIRSLIEIVKNGQTVDGTANMYDLYYKSRGTGKLVKTGTNVERLSAAFTALYTTFIGDKVMCVAPTQEQLDEYGLGANDACYYITAKLGKEDTDMYSFQISQLIDGYYYTLSPMYGEGNEMLVRIPQVSLSFLGSDDKVIFEWAGTDISSLFYQYLKKTDDGQPGMFEMAVRIKKTSDSGEEIIYDISHKYNLNNEGAEGFVAIQDDGVKYKTENTVNQFVNFYTLLIRLPGPNEFNNLTEEEIADLTKDDSALVFELYARDNSDKIFKYKFYQIGKSLDVMAVSCKGEIIDGQEVWEQEQINFNVPLDHIEKLRQSYICLINGEDVNIDF